MSERFGATGNFKEYDKSHDHFFYSSTDDYRDDISDDETNTSVAPQVRRMVLFGAKFYRGNARDKMPRVLCSMLNI